MRARSTLDWSQSKIFLVLLYLTSTGYATHWHNIGQISTDKMQSQITKRDRKSICGVNWCVFQWHFNSM